MRKKIKAILLAVVVMGVVGIMLTGCSQSSENSSNVKRISDEDTIHVNEWDSDIEWECEVISEKNGHLSNGDSIILSVEETSGNFSANWGLVPSRVKLEVEVTGLEN